MWDLQSEDKNGLLTAQQAEKARKRGKSQITEEKEKGAKGKERKGEGKEKGNKGKERKRKREEERKGQIKKDIKIETHRSQ